VAALEVILSDYSYVGGYAPSAQDNKVGGFLLSCAMLCYVCFCPIIFAKYLLLTLFFLLLFRC